MKEVFSRLCCATALPILSFFCADLQADTTEVVLSNSMKCTKEELMTFFPKQIVESILIQAKLPKDKAEKIAEELAKKDKEFAKTVEERAEKVQPNPFQDLSQRDLAIRIYRETLYEVFAKVLKENGVTSEDQIQTLLDEMQNEKSKRFIECIRKQPHPSEPSS